MRFIGVDPGLGGGIAVLSVEGVPLLTSKMPESERDILDLLEEFGGTDTLGRPKARAVLERVRSSPQMGVTSSFTFGRGYGGLRMALTALRIPFDEVTPQAWQKAMSCLTKGDKNVSKRRAQDLFPTVKCTHAISDALLLADYSRRVHAPHMVQEVVK